MATILVEYPKNDILKCHIHTLHHIDLYQDYLYGKVSTIEYEATDSLEDLLGKSYSNWAAEELLKVGVVSVYHFLEKCIVSFLYDQFKKQNIDIPHKGRKSLVVWVKTTLEHIFSPIEDEKVWTNLNELRIVANTIKHANSGKYKELSALHIEYFQMIESDCFDDIQEYENRFFIGIDNFRRLAKSTASFWEHLPHEVIYTR